MGKTISIVGCGPGSPDFLTRAAIEAVENAGVLVGARRLLDLFPDSPAERIELEIGLTPALDLVSGKLDRAVAFLVSGDPGIFSLAKLVIKRFGRDSCRVIPGVSSVQAAFAAVGTDWQDAKIVSAHKEDPGPELTRDLAGSEKIAVLGGRAASLAWLERFVKGLSKEYRVFVCEDLSLDTERVFETAAEEILELEVGSRVVFIVLKSHLLS